MIQNSTKSSNAVQSKTDYIPAVDNFWNNIENVSLQVPLSNLPQDSKRIQPLILKKPIVQESISKYSYSGLFGRPANPNLFDSETKKVAPKSTFMRPAPAVK